MKLIEIIVIIASVLFVIGVAIATIRRKIKNKKTGCCSSCCGCSYSSNCGKSHSDNVEKTDESANNIENLKK